MDEFQYQTYPRQVIFATGALASIRQNVESLGCRRLLLCTSHSLCEQGQPAALEAALGKRLAGVFDRVQPHVQDVQVGEALELASQREVDGVIGMGGGSPIGMAKAVARALMERDSREITRAAPIPVVAIPSTYAGSEMTPIFGITHSGESPRRKVTISDPRITPRLVIYDPALTLGLPREMTAASGINALAHCIEALYSIRRNPLSTAAAMQGVRHIHRALLRCHRHGEDLEARSEMLLGAHLAGLSLASVAMGLHHGLCHVLGGTANVPHGIANSIILPHAIRFNAQSTAAELLPAAEAMNIATETMGVAGDGSNATAAIEKLAQKISELTGSMDLPQRLRDAGVRQSDLAHIAQLGFENQTVQNNPRPISDASQIEQLLREAW